MAVDGSLVNRNGKIGQTYQRNSVSLVDAYCWGLVGNISETDTTYTFSFSTSFWYGGCMNCIPVEVGYFVFAEDGTFDQASSYYKQGFWASTGATTSSWWNGSDWNWWQIDERTATVTKQSDRYVGILPYAKIGCINRWGSDGHFANGEDWDLFNTEYGILIANSVDQANFQYQRTWTYNGLTRTLDSYSYYSGLNNSTEFSYANCPIKIKQASPVWVYNSSQVPKRASAVYVYNSSGVPKKAKSITVYDSSGKPKTVSL